MTYIFILVFTKLFNPFKNINILKHKFLVLSLTFLSATKKTEFKNALEIKLEINFWHILLINAISGELSRPCGFLWRRAKAGRESL